MHFHVEAHDEVTSTNDLVKQAIAAGAPEGLVVTALTQTAGYGRRGNPWNSGSGGLYMSLLLKPMKPVEQLPTLSLVTALAVRRTLASCIPQGDILKIKWPNDVVVMREGDENIAFRKICGISLERSGDAVCLGIGINVRTPSCETSTRCDTSRMGHRNIPVYLQDFVPTDSLPSLDVLRDKLLTQLALVYEAWTTDGFAPLKDEFMQHFALKGFKVRIDEAQDTPIACKVLGISDCGHLLVIPEGQDAPREIAAGTVTIIS